MPLGTARPGPLGVRVERWLDGAADGLVAAFALWTIAYEVALAAQASLWVPGAVWVPVALLCAVAGAVRNVRNAAVEPRTASAAPGTARDLPGPRPLLLVGLLVGLLALLVPAVLLHAEVGVLPGLLVALAVVALGLLPRSSPRPGSEVSSQPHPAAGRTVVALVVCAAAAVFASLYRRSDADDVFYMNRATWVAEHGVPALRDTMFGPETYESTYGGGLPFPSVEALFGALAHLLDVRAGTFAYVGVVPVLAFAAAWATWRLVRAWTGSRAVPVFLVAVLVVLVSGDSIVGAYSVGRIWQGKVIAFAVLAPLVWTYLSALVRTDRRAVRDSQVMLLLSGVAFAGLTAGAPLLAPTFAGAAGLAAVLLRSRDLLVGALLFLVGPVVAGLSVVLGPNGVGEGDSGDLMSLDHMFAVQFGTGMLHPLVGVLAVTLGVRLVRPEAVVLASCASLAALVAMLPGVTELARRAHRRRSHRLAAHPARPGRRPDGGARCRGPPAARACRPVRLVAGLLAVVVVVVSGRPLWQVTHASIDPAPRWKVDQVALADVEEVLDLPAEEGLLLLPERQSEVLAIYTTSRFAAVPRVFYLVNLDDTWSASPPGTPCTCGSTAAIGRSHGRSGPSSTCSTSRCCASRATTPEWWTSWNRWPTCPGHRWTGWDRWCVPRGRAARRRNTEVTRGRKPFHARNIGSAGRETCRPEGSGQRSGPAAATASSPESRVPLPGSDGGSVDGYYAFMLIATAFVLMMTVPALALFYGGMSRSKSVLNMMMMSYIAAAIVGILYVAVGWSMGFERRAARFFARPVRRCSGSTASPPTATSA